MDSYLEKGGEGLTVRPWVWIALLFLGPFAGTLAFQWYVYTVVSVAFIELCIQLFDDRLDQSDGACASYHHPACV